MPTLEDLFKNGTLERGPYAGQTPKDAFYPRNANKIPLSSNSPVINSTSMKALNKLRSGNGSILEETLLEQETTGLRVLNTLSQPLLYGFESGRLTTRTTKPLTDMKLATGGDATGLLGGFLQSKVGKSIQSTFQKVQKFVGIPSLATPTYTLNDGGLQSTNQIQKQYNTKLEDIRQGALGNPLGGLIGGLLKGGLTDPNQLKKKAITGAIGLANGFLRDKIIGGTTASTNNFDFNKYPTFKNGVLEVRNYGSTKNGNLGFRVKNIKDTEGNTISLDAGGRKYTSFFLPRIEFTQNSENLLGLKFSNVKDVEENREFGIVSFTSFPTLDVKNLEGTNDKKTGTISSPERPAKISKKEFEDRKNEIEGLKGNKNARYNPSSFGIHLNSKESYEIKPDDTSVDDLDSVVLKFESVKQNKAVNFLATITGLNESFSPSWESNKFIGNPFNFYTYSGLERSVVFAFKIFSLNPQEHINAWNRVNFLSSLVYPQAFEGDAGYVTAPFLRLTIGDLYKRKEGFIENLSYSFDDETPWEIGGNISSAQGDINMKGYVLPRVINVDTTFKFIEQRSSVEGKKYYSFGPIT